MSHSRGVRPAAKASAKKAAKSGRPPGSMLCSADKVDDRFGTGRPAGFNSLAIISHKSVGVRAARVRGVAKRQSPSKLRALPVR